MVGVKKLVRNQMFDPNLSDDIGKTPLQKAARGGKRCEIPNPIEDPNYLGVAQYLLKMGANVGLNDALLLAIACNQLEISRLLVSAGAFSDEEMEAVFFATRTGDEMLKLVCRIVKIDSQDRFGDTALHDCVIGNRVVAVKRLLENGASKETANDKHQTPLAIAVAKQFGKIIKLLI